MHDCLKMRKMARNRVLPVQESAAVYTVPMDRTPTCRLASATASDLDYASQQEAYIGGQFDSDFNLNLDPQYKIPGSEEEQTGLQPTNDTEMKVRGRGIIYYLAVDVPILLIVATVLPLLELGIIPFHRSGYYCQDPTLSYAFTGDTVSMELLVISTIILPILVMWPVEALLYRPSEYSIKTKRWFESLKTSSLWYREYTYGNVMNLLTVEIMKMTMGNPRPTFLAICQPDNMHTCVRDEYVTNYTCTATEFSKWFTLDASRSFPSGHTSLSVYCGLFIAWYLQRRTFSWRNPTLFLVPLLQVLCIAYAVVCSLTRITDHRHHWWDVLTGTIIGIVATFYACLVLCKNFAFTATASSSDISSSDSAHNHPSVRRLLSSGNSDHTLPHAHIAHVP